MGEHVAAFHTATNALQALGRGFDVNFDTRLLYCKGISGSRVVEIDLEHPRDLLLYDDVVIPNVPRDIRNSQEPEGRHSSGVFTFQEMVEYFNHKANISGSFALGRFNSAFSFTGSKHVDAAATKTLSSDGFYIPLAKVQLTKSQLILEENVKRAVPIYWDPPSLASFIEKYGTHVITSITIGGKDVIYVKQHHTSPLSKSEIKNYIEDIGNQRFADIDSHTSSGQTKFKDKGVEPFSFNNQGIHPQPTTATYPTGKEDVTVIFRRRGGDDLEQNHSKWVRTVKSSPDIIEMTFCPITDLLDERPGKEHLARAVGLYLEYKPPIEELRYFLEFQIPRVWAPIQDKIPGHQRKEPVCPSLQFSIMGQKLYISQEQITVGRRPVTGLRLCLEGSKQNRLSVHLQHLVSLPKILQPYWDSHVAIGAPKWQGPEEQDSRWFEPVKWKKFSHVSTAPIENPETFISDFSGVCIVTGAQLGVWDFGSRNILYMKLLYSRLPGCTIRRSLWDHTPNKALKIVTASNTSNPDESSTGSRENVGRNKFVKFVDLSEMSQGPQDPPGHWLVTGGKLGVENGKIVLRVKYSLLNY
ncbi:putative membrane attack complex component/perforin (MACPF) domain-containing protein [Lupinus albus]|uniref:Putative membrane attack complex component/perforin (MACPF) domain-containing protein n=1 Tax=Lupinus albus TaxID=3870 RepID=A0A6A4PNI9_LUPAL|nr:putative membrane attack complex component/perforin (MACPF) domain-containing protein [Lupinus albus]